MFGVFSFDIFSFFFCFLHAVFVAFLHMLFRLGFLRRFFFGCLFILFAFLISRFLFLIDSCDSCLFFCVFHCVFNCLRQCKELPQGRADMIWAVWGYCGFCPAALCHIARLPKMMGLAPCLVFVVQSGPGTKMGAQTTMPETASAHTWIFRPIVDQLGIWIELNLPPGYSLEPNVSYLVPERYPRDPNVLIRTSICYCQGQLEGIWVAWASSGPCSSLTLRLF